jgi:hypothetical protein
MELLPRSGKNDALGAVVLSRVGTCKTLLDVTVSLCSVGMLIVPVDTCSLLLNAKLNSRSEGMLKELPVDSVPASETLTLAAEGMLRELMTVKAEDSIDTVCTSGRVIALTTETVLLPASFK